LIIYEECEPGLAAVQHILSFPTAWPELDTGIRRCQLQRFPYGIIYATEQDAILIIAIMHLHRRPGYWHTRRK